MFRLISIGGSNLPPKFNDEENKMNAAKSPPPKTSSNEKTPVRRKRVTPTKSREQMIAETAYYLAEKRGFASGDDQQDWYEAERIVQERFPEA